MERPEPGQCLRCGEVELDLAAPCLRRNGIPVHLAENYWKALDLLVKRNGTVVTKQELCEVLGRVAEGTLTKVIERIRGSLGDTTLPRRFIASQPGVGYRWLVPFAREVPPAVLCEQRAKQMTSISGYIWPAPPNFDPAQTSVLRKPEVEPPIPQETLWGVNVALGPGIYIANSASFRFIPFFNGLKEEIETKLLNQCGRHIPFNCTAGLAAYNGRSDMLTTILEPGGKQIGEIWFGTDPDNAWKYDGLVRVGNDTYVVWQVFQRYSDGTYRRLRMQPPRSAIKIGV